MLLALENSGGFCGVVHFWCCVFSFIFICQCFSFCWCCIFIWFPGYFACHWHSTLASQTREGLQQLWALPWLLSIVFSFSSTASTTVLSGHFLPTSIFYLMLLLNIFGTFPTFRHNLLLSRFHQEPAVTFLKVAGLQTDPQNTDPAHQFVQFTVIHNLLYILSLYLCMSILQKFYFWWKIW